MLPSSRLARLSSVVIAVSMIQCGAGTYISVHVNDDGSLASEPDTLVFRVSDTNKVLLDDAMSLGGDTTLPLDLLVEPGPTTSSTLSFQVILLAGDSTIGAGSVTRTWTAGQTTDIALEVSAL